MRIRTCFGTVAALGLAATVSAQPLSFRFETSSQTFTPLHSYVSAEQSGDMLFFCGITGFGLHKLSTPMGPEPIFADSADYNQMAVLADPDTGTVMTGSLAHLSGTVRDALLVTNASGFQSGDTLYIYGGYGPNAAGTDVVTKGNVTEVDLAAVRAAILGEFAIPPSAFTVINSTAALTTGAEIFPLGNDRFVLFGGANFIGDYPSHTLEGYTDAAHVFDLAVSSTVPVQTIVSEDPFVTTDLHRRDLNGIPAAMSDGMGGRDYGFIVTGGVFRFGFGPYTTPVTWMEGDTYAVEDLTTTIKLNLYHSPSASFTSETAGHNRSVIFGGITAYDSIEAPTANFLLPWSDMISENVFDGTTFVEERFLGNTPLPMANAHLVLNTALPIADNHQINLNELPPNEILLGSVWGGIRAAEPTGSPMTWASGEVVDIYMVKGVRGDLTANGVTDSADLAVLLAGWGTGFTSPDLNWDGIVDSGDLAILLAFWGRDFPG